jgi:hypothetical protein
MNAPKQSPALQSIQIAADGHLGYAKALNHLIYRDRTARLQGFKDDLMALFG